LTNNYKSTYGYGEIEILKKDKFIKMDPALGFNFYNNSTNENVVIGYNNIGLGQNGIKTWILISLVINLIQLPVNLLN